jgi:hypothetical protein
MPEMRKEYKQQAMLVVQVIPLLAAHPDFALKGGTAINYFLRPFPRLSVDIDLAFLPLMPRELSLEMISISLDGLKEEILSRYPGLSIQQKKLQARTAAPRVAQGSSTIKIEPNLVVRGSVYPAVEKDIAEEVEKELGLFASAKCLSKADVYGGKICAALDRQHPRDLFDIKLLLENEGITEEIRRAFIVYLISHSRPMAELLARNFLDIDAAFVTEFIGMTRIPVRTDELINAREQLIFALRTQLTKDERQFILSIKSGSPQWQLFPIRNIEELPAVRWKLQNIRQMSKSKHTAAIQKLKQALEL